MPTRKKKKRPAARRPAPKPRETKDDVIRRLERRLKRLGKEHAAEIEQYERRIAATKRAADRRLAVMMRELAALRHHEARAETLARMLAARDAEPTDGGARTPLVVGGGEPGREPAP